MHNTSSESHYVASASIKMENPESKEAAWNIIKLYNNIEYKWRVIDKKIIQVVAGLFSDFDEALKCAQYMYSNLLLDVLESDNTISCAGCEYGYGQFCSDDEEKLFMVEINKCQEIKPGICVFKVEDSMTGIDNVTFIDLPIEVPNYTSCHVDFSKIDSYEFQYSKENQEIFALLVKANKAYGYNARMSFYCTVLELLADKCEFPKQKSEKLIEEIEKLKSDVNSSDLTDEEKNTLAGALESIKSIGSKQKVLQVITKYGKSTYMSIPSKQIINEAYSQRSQYDHNGTETPHKINKSFPMKELTLDVVKNFICRKAE